MHNNLLGLLVGLLVGLVNSPLRPIWHLMSLRVIKSSDVPSHISRRVLVSQILMLLSSIFRSSIWSWRSWCWTFATRSRKPLDVNKNYKGTIEVVQSCLCDRLQINWMHWNVWNQNYQIWHYICKKWRKVSKPIAQLGKFSKPLMLFRLTFVSQANSLSTLKFLIISKIWLTFLLIRAKTIWFRRSSQKRWHRCWQFILVRNPWWHRNAVVAGSVVRTVLALHNLVKNRLELKAKGEKCEGERKKGEQVKKPAEKDVEKVTSKTSK